MPTDSVTEIPSTGDFEGHILAVAKTADRAAFGELFEHFGPRLKSYFIRLGLPAARAEELAQETMLSVWRKAKYFDPERAGAATWIFVIARNLRIDLLRRERAELGTPIEAAETASDQAGADDVVAASEREGRVRGAAGCQG